MFPGNTPCTHTHQKEIDVNEVESGRHFLEHFGVKGMRWGVRRKRVARSSDAEAHGKASAKKLHELSDTELRGLVLRMDMEKSAKRLNPNVVTSGHNVVKGMLAAGITANAVIAFAQSSAGKALAKQLGKAVNIPVGSIGRTG